MEQVRKRDGRFIAYQREKITRAIFLAASEVAKREGAFPNYHMADALSSKVEDLLYRKFSSSVPTVEDIQDAVVKVLIEEGHAKTSEAYILYRAERSQIRDSKTRLMKTIGDITFLEAEKSDIKRENANINGNTAMGTMLQYGSAVSKEFCKQSMVRKEHAQAHDQGDIHIHDMDFLAMGTLTCCQISLSEVFQGGFSTGHGFLREPQDIMSYAALAAIVIQSNQNDQHGGQSVPAFDYDLANGVQKTFKKSYKEHFKKALSLLVSSPLGKDELFYALEKAQEQYYLLEMDTALRQVNCAVDFLCKQFSIDQDLCAKIEKFAFDEAVSETDRKTYQAMEAFIHNLNTMHSRAGAQVPFSSLNFGTDTSSQGRMVTKNLLLAQEKGLGNGETPIFPILIFKVKEGINFNLEDPNYDLFQLAMGVSSKRLFPNFSFLDAPFNYQYYKKNHPETEAVYMGCRTRVVGNVDGEEQVFGRGNLSFTTLNLPRRGIIHGIITAQRKQADMKGFYRDLDEKVDLVFEQLLERYEIQANKKVKNFPFLMGQGVWKGSKGLNYEDSLREVLSEGTLTVGFIGLAECLIALTGLHHGESALSQELGIQIITHLRKRCDEKAKETGLNFSLIATPAEGLSGRFTRMDEKAFGPILGVTDKEYYTNSFHVPVYYEISAFDKIRLEAPYHALTNAGHISYVEVDGSPSNNPQAFETIIRAMKEAGIGYGSVNHPLDRDSLCGYSGVIGDTCPGCGRAEGDVPFERIRRITGYLVGTLERFNDAKRSEVRDRVKHGQ